MQAHTLRNCMRGCGSSLNLQRHGAGSIIERVDWVLTVPDCVFSTTKAGLNTDFIEFHLTSTFLLHI